MSDSLKILLVGPLPPPAGGMANQTRQLRELLLAEGLDVTLVQTNAPYRPAWVGQIRGVRAVFRFIPYLRSLWRGLHGVQLVHVMANSGLAWSLLAKPAIVLAGWRKVPVLINYRGGLAEEFLQRSGRRVIPAMRRSALVVVPSGFLHEVFGRYGVGTEIIPNVVNLDVFCPPRNRIRDATNPHIVIARNLEEIYGIDTAIEAVALLVKTVPNLRVSVAGSGPERGRLQHLVEKRGLTNCVRFTGRLDRQQMAALYQDADLSLNSARVDNMPNSVLEALACGVPVVSTDVGGIPYLLKHGRTAWLIPADSPADMAAGLIRVLEDESLSSLLRENGLRLVEQFIWPKIKVAWLEAYRRIGVANRTPATESSASR